jgi:VanZ family protein
LHIQWSLLAVMQTLVCWTTAPASVRTWRALWVLALVVVSCLAFTPKPLEGVETGLDKVGHVTAFTVLAFCGSLAFPATRGPRTALLLGLLAYGGLIEVLQLFVPGRSAEWGDLIADGIGIAFGTALAAFVVRLGLRQRLATRAD